MRAADQITTYIQSLPEPKRSDLQSLHEWTVQSFPDIQLWFTDGKDNDGKVVANPNIGYGRTTIEYADGSVREFFRVGLSANTAGFSLYVFGLKDKSHLAQTYGARIGKAKVSGYCIKFRSLKDVDIDVVKELVTDMLTDSE